MMAASELDTMEKALNQVSKKIAELMRWTQEDEGELTEELLINLAEMHIFPTTMKLKRIIEILDMLKAIKTSFQKLQDHKVCEKEMQQNVILVCEYRKSIQTVLDIILSLFETEDACLLNWMIDLEHDESIKTLLELANDVQYVVKEFYRFQDLVFSAILFYDYIAFNRKEYSINLEKKDMLQHIITLGTTSSAKPPKNDMRCFPLHSFLSVDLLLMTLSRFSRQMLQMENGGRQFLSLTALKITLKHINGMLPWLPPVRLSQFQQRCVEIKVSYSSVLLGVEKLVPMLSLIEDVTCRKTKKLKHLCRMTIRNQLFSNWTLQDGIDSLNIPSTLKSYIKLERFEDWV